LSRRPLEKPSRANSVGAASLAAGADKTEDSAIKQARRINGNPFRNKASHFFAGLLNISKAHDTLAGEDKETIMRVVEKCVLSSGDGFLQSAARDLFGLIGGASWPDGDERKRPFGRITAGECLPDDFTRCRNIAKACADEMRASAKSDCPFPGIPDVDVDEVWRRGLLHSADTAERAADTLVNAAKEALCEPIS